MHVEDAIRNRRAVKVYDPDFQLDRETRNELFQLARLAPTAFNLQHVRFVDVTDPQLRARIREVGWDQAQMTDATMLVIVCAQVDSWAVNARRVWEGAPEEVQAYMAGAIDDYYRDKPETQRDEAIRSCGLVAQTLMLAAQGKGLDSGPMIGFDFEAVGRLINLPQGHVIGLMVAIGKRLQEPKARVGKLDLDDIVVVDHF